MPAGHDDDVSRDIAQIEFSIIERCLNYQIKPEKAAQSLNLLMPGVRQGKLENQGNQSIRVWMRQLFSLIWAIAKQLNPNGKGYRYRQHRLMKLFNLLPSTPTFLTITNGSGEQVSPWTEFFQCDIQSASDRHSELRRALRPPAKENNPNTQICDYYVNASTFAARFFQEACPNVFYMHGPTIRLGRTLAFNAINKAAGGRLPESELLPCHYLAAAQWMDMAADWLFQQVRWDHPQYYKDKETARGHQGLRPKRWMR